MSNLNFGWSAFKSSRNGYDRAKIKRHPQWSMERSPTEETRLFWDYKDISRSRPRYFTWTFGYEILLTRTRMNISLRFLDLFKRKSADFLWSFITFDKPLCPNYTPESKQQSKQLVETGWSSPTKAKTVSSAGEVSATVFLDVHGVVLIKYLLKGNSKHWKSVTQHYWSNRSRGKALENVTAKLHEIPF